VTARDFYGKYFWRNLAQIPKELEKFIFAQAVNFVVRRSLPNLQKHIQVKYWLETRGPLGKGHKIPDCQEALK
jgi:lysozyme family protein